MEYSAGLPCSYKFTVQIVPKTNSLPGPGFEPLQHEISRIRGRNRNLTDKKPACFTMGISKKSRYFSHFQNSVSFEKASLKRILWKKVPMQDENGS